MRRVMLAGRGTHFVKVHYGVSRYDPVAGGELPPEGSEHSSVA
jgi:hypothetical protein